MNKVKCDCGCDNDAVRYMNDFKYEAPKTENNVTGFERIEPVLNGFVVRAVCSECFQQFKPFMQNCSELI